jgi:L-2,4-diaminobutyrate decarboxylase
MHPIIREAYDAEIFRREGHLLVDLLADYLRDVVDTDQWPALAWQSPEAAFDYWNGMWQQSDG